MSKKPTPREQARGAAQVAAVMRQRYPDRQQMQVEGVDGSLLKVRRSHWPEGFAISVPVRDQGLLDEAGAGMAVFVDFERGKRQMPVVSSRAGQSLGRIFVTPAILPGLWTQPEGQPGITHSSRSAQPQLLLSVLTAANYLASLYRTVDNTPFVPPDETSTDVLGLLLYNIGPSASPTDTLLAAMYAVWDDAAALTGPRVVVLEHALVGTALAPIDIPIAVQRWHPAAATQSINTPNRQQGYFFAHQLSESDVCLTVAVDAGIVAFLRSNPSTQQLSPWVDDPRRYEGRAGNIGCVGQYLIECGYTGLNIDGPSGGNTNNFIPGGALLQLYTRSGLTYTPLAPVDLAALVPGSGMSGYATSRKGILSVGILKPLPDFTGEPPEPIVDTGYQFDLPSTRWPFLSLGIRREWWIYLNARSDPDPHWMTLAVDAKTGSVAIVDDFEPDFATWLFLFPDVVGVREGQFAAQEACHFREPVYGEFGQLTFTPESFPCGTTGYALGSEIITVTFDPGDPEGDPPTDPRTADIVDVFETFRTGQTYTGLDPQPAGIPLSSPGEGFLAAPFEGGPINEEQTSGQCPAGVFGVLGDSNLHFGVCFEPQHYVYDVIQVINPPTEADPSGLEAWGDIFRSENPSYPNPGVEDYVFEERYRFRLIEEGGDGTGHPPLELPQPWAIHYPAEPPPPPEHPSNYGNIYVLVNGRVWRFYKVKTHGEYVYGIWYRTWVTVCDADGKTLKYRTDISKYLVDGPLDGFGSRNPTPQYLTVWQWLAPTVAFVGDPLWVLRQDHWDTTPDVDGIQTNAGQEPFLEMWQIGESELSLFHQIVLHPTFDLPARAWTALYDHPPRMMQGVDLATNNPYVTVWTEWTNGVDTGHLITEVILAVSGFTKTERWDASAFPVQPKAMEAVNSVHHDGTLWWLKDGNQLVVAGAP